jgi:hypothetical protein
MVLHREVDYFYIETRLEKRPKPDIGLLVEDIEGKLCGDSVLPARTASVRVARSQRMLIVCSLRRELPQD